LTAGSVVYLNTSPESITICLVSKIHQSCTTVYLQQGCSVDSSGLDGPMGQAHRTSELSTTSTIFRKNLSRPPGQPRPHRWSAAALQTTCLDDGSGAPSRKPLGFAEGVSDPLWRHIVWSAVAVPTEMPGLQEHVFQTLMCNCIHVFYAQARSTKPANHAVKVFGIAARWSWSATIRTALFIHVSSVQPEKKRQFKFEHPAELNPTIVPAAVHGLRRGLPGLL
jgi:hypothetical protein